MYTNALGSCTRRLLIPLIFMLSAAPAIAGGDAVRVEDFNLPAQDALGWSQLSPSTDSRLVYVDSTNGNDGNASFHLPGDSEIGPDPQNPAGTVRAFRTLDAASAQLRQDQPDWLLLRAGGVWTESLPFKRGRSATERAVVMPYGQGPRPELRTGSNKGIETSQPVNVAIVGIRFWAHTRDTEGPHFTGYAGSSGMHFYSRETGDPRQVRDVLIEDCVFRAYSNNVFTGSQPAEPFTRLVIRRSIISGNYSTEAHAQGIYHVGAGQPLQPSILLQENLFDHNGWRIQSINGDNDKADGQATIFNHNTYFTEANGVVFQRNLFLRASSIGTKWTSGGSQPGRARGIVIDDNLYAEGEVGISMGGNAPGGPMRWDGIVIRDNVFTDVGRSRPTNRSLSWGIEAIDWLSGEILGNLFIHQRSGIGNTYAIKVSAPDAAGSMRIAGNVIARLEAGDGNAAVVLANGDRVDQVLFENNIVQSPSTNPLVRLESGGYAFAGANQYHSMAAPGSQFRVDGNPVDLATWISATGDTGASSTPPAFPDPQRDIEGYMVHLGLGNDFDDFIVAVYAQSRTNWNPALTAGAINDWLRGGFGMPTANDRIFDDGFQP